MFQVTIVKASLPCFATGPGARVADSVNADSFPIMQGVRQVDNPSLADI